MSITRFHAKYFANELTKRCPSDSVEKLAGALSDAQVDLNPHQIEAALFAFRSPLSKGAILADEVGLGKTIEAGILLSQRWAEGRRHLLVICPANLRKQWAQELADKFYLPSEILEARTFNDWVRAGNLNPFDQPAVIICSFQFARGKEPYVHQTPWDLVVVDEAHRLRNVYKPGSKIAQSIKDAIAPFHKVLLTATPLQNSLLELYGLVSIIDEFAFGDKASFQTKYARWSDNADFAVLKDRLRPICKRTLRKQVLEYVSYTNRHALVQEFVPTDEEQRLYELVSEYLRRPNLYALPSAQRQLMTLILRKLLASSTYAISGTLQGLAERLEHEADTLDNLPENLAQDFEALAEIEDEWAEDDEGSESDDEPKAKRRVLTPEQREELRGEIATLREFHELAKSIVKNSKGEVLLTALRRGFEQSAKAQKGQGAATLQQKALIFTESRRTQDYLYRILEQTEFAGKVVLFNGSNTDPKSREIYQQWLERHAGTDRISGSPTSDKRAALVDYFRDDAAIMIATEAAAEGINLQFCNLVVNYDLPWNPQRIEQRIGRCHRYGQLFDVVVVNFLNKKNAADVRVYQLLDEKFRLFDGVFGASDEVLGALESGVDFEKRIAAIYQKCRTSYQIAFEFDELQKDLEVEIDDKRREARELLLNNFDREVVEKLRIESADFLGRFEDQLWRVTRFFLEEYARFDAVNYSFSLERNPFPSERIHLGPYRLARRSGRIAEDPAELSYKKVLRALMEGKPLPAAADLVKGARRAAADQLDSANTYRLGHPLAQCILEHCRSLDAPPAEVVFAYGGTPMISVLDSLVGASGWLTCIRLTVNAFETEDYLLFAGITDEGKDLDTVQCRRLFDLAAEESRSVPNVEGVEKRLDKSIKDQEVQLFVRLNDKSTGWFDAEMDKLDRWADDRRTSLKSNLDELDAKIRAAKRESRFAGSLPEKLEIQRQLRQLETKRNDAWRSYDEASRDLDRQKDALLDDVSQRLKQHVEHETLFTIRWRLEAA
jgi:Superfamily II DNA/RNA helicases, SNF2 family